MGSSTSITASGFTPIYNPDALPVDSRRLSSLPPLAAAEPNPSKKKGGFLRLVHKVKAWFCKIGHAIASWFKGSNRKEEDKFIHYWKYDPFNKKSNVPTKNEPVVQNLEKSLSNGISLAIDVALDHYKNDSTFKAGVDKTKKQALSAIEIAKTIIKTMVPLGNQKAKPLFKMLERYRPDVAKLIDQKGVDDLTDALLQELLKGQISDGGIDVFKAETKAAIKPMLLDELKKSPNDDLNTLFAPHNVDEYIDPILDWFCDKENRKTSLEEVLTAKDGYSQTLKANVLEKIVIALVNNKIDLMALEGQNFLNNPDVFVEKFIKPNIRPIVHSIVEPAAKMVDQIPYRQVFDKAVGDLKEWFLVSHKVEKIVEERKQDALMAIRYKQKECKPLTDAETAQAREYDCIVAHIKEHAKDKIEELRQQHNRAAALMKNNTKTQGQDEKALKNFYHEVKRAGGFDKYIVKILPSLMDPYLDALRNDKYRKNLHPVTLEALFQQKSFVDTATGMTVDNPTAKQWHDHVVAEKLDRRAADIVIALFPTKEGVDGFFSAIAKNIVLPDEVKELVKNYHDLIIKVIPEEMRNKFFEKINDKETVDAVKFWYAIAETMAMDFIQSKVKDILVSVMQTMTDENKFKELLAFTVLPAINSMLFQGFIKDQIIGHKGKNLKVMAGRFHQLIDCSQDLKEKQRQQIAHELYLLSKNRNMELDFEKYGIDEKKFEGEALNAIEELEQFFYAYKKSDVNNGKPLQTNDIARLIQKLNTEEKVTEKSPIADVAMVFGFDYGKIVGGNVIRKIATHFVKPLINQKIVNVLKPYKATWLYPAKKGARILDKEFNSVEKVKSLLFGKKEGKPVSEQLDDQISFLSALMYDSIVLDLPAWQRFFAKRSFALGPNKSKLKEAVKDIFQKTLFQHVDTPAGLNDALHLNESLFITILDLITTNLKAAADKNDALKKRQVEEINNREIVA